MLGVHRGGDATQASRSARVREYESWCGRPVSDVLDFYGRGDTWAKIDDPRWVLNAWVDRPWQLTLSVPMMPSTAFTLEAGARGVYDDHWRRFFATVAATYPTLIVRLGWEFNIKSFPWAAGGREAQFVAYWRRIVTIGRKAAPSVRYDWCPLAGNANANVVAAYPGDAYVDVIGLDAYDTARVGLTGDARWKHQLDRPCGLVWHRSFARLHGKPMSFPEWGLTVRPNDLPGGGDNPLYIERMLGWIGENNASACYFEVNARDAVHRLMPGPWTNFPKAAAKFLALT